MQHLLLKYIVNIVAQWCSDKFTLMLGYNETILSQFSKKIVWIRFYGALIEDFQLQSFKRKMGNSILKMLVQHGGNTFF